IKRLFFFCLCLLLLTGPIFNSIAFQASPPSAIHVWEMQEIVLEAENEYKNYYTYVTVWVDLKGPDFSKRIYGCWDGGNTYRVRIVASSPGQWQWTSGSKQDDLGLNDQSGEFTAVAWSEQEKAENPNRRGFVGATSNGHALQYADGTPFFMVGDT